VTTIDLTATGDAVVRDLPHEQYLQHPALSHSGAKTLVRPGGPARYLHEREHGRPPKDEFDVGHAAHNAVLGVGPELVIVDANDWRTKAAQQARELARASGKVAVLTKTADQVADMARALRAHPVASRLLHVTTGEPEVSLFWHDEQHGVDRRGRVDWLRTPDKNGRLILVDYKTTTDASAEALERSVIRFGYHMQSAWYRDLVVGLGLAKSAPFLFVFQEVSAPYLVHVIELEPDLLAMGDDLNRRALALYADCVERDTWPGYNDGGITSVHAPAWALRQHEATLQDELEDDLS
jgi:PDDEXK-like domain of unknown function (DUF3799)